MKTNEKSREWPHTTRTEYLNHKIVHGHIIYLHRTKPSTSDTLSQFKATKQERNTQDSPLQAGIVPIQRRQNTRNSSSPSENRSNVPQRSLVGISLTPSPSQSKIFVSHRSRSAGSLDSSAVSPLSYEYLGC